MLIPFMIPYYFFKCLDGIRWLILGSIMVFFYIGISLILQVIFTPFGEIFELYDELKKLFASNGRYQISAAKVIDIDKTNNTIKFLFPYEERNLILIKGYLRKKEDVQLPIDITRLIHYFYGRENKYNFEYQTFVVSYKHVTAVGVSSGYIDVLHGSDVGHRKPHAIPIFIFGRYKHEMTQCLILCSWIEEIWNVLGLFWIAIPLRIMCIICWPVFIFALSIIVLTEMVRSRSMGITYYNTPNNVLKQLLVK